MKIFVLERNASHQQQPMIVAYQGVQSCADYIEISLSGDLSLIPSASNNRQFFKMGNKIRSCKSNEALAWYDQMKYAYAIYGGKGLQLNCSAKEKGFAIFSLAHINARRDTHNLTKAGCDILQQLEIVKNDRYIDAVAIMAEEQYKNETRIVLINSRAAETLRTSVLRKAWKLSN